MAQVSEKSNHLKRLKRVKGLYPTLKRGGFYALIYNSLIEQLSVL